MRSLLVSTLVAVALAGCGTPPAKTENASPNNANAQPNNAVNSQNGCDDPAPGCGVCEAPVCEGGEWACLGTPCAQPGCDEPAPDCAASCDGGGMAVCEDRIWRCVGSDGSSCEAPTCEASSTSTLSGVSIEFDAPRCVWTLAEVAAGIEIPYTVRITEPHEISPSSQQNGCDEPGPTGLRLAERISGGEQLYCLCDVGLCADEPITVSLVPGETDLVLAWDGVNWTGPSDFGNPKGAPFPPGQYEAQVRAVGTVEGEPYEVVATLPFELVD